MVGYGPGGERKQAPEVSRNGWKRLPCVCACACAPVHVCPPVCVPVHARPCTCARACVPVNTHPCLGSGDKGPGTAPRPLSLARSPWRVNVWAHLRHPLLLAHCPALEAPTGGGPELGGSLLWAPLLE